MNQSQSLLCMHSQIHASSTFMQNFSGITFLWNAIDNFTSHGPISQIILRRTEHVEIS